MPILFLALRGLESRATRRPLGVRGVAVSAAAIALGATVLYGGAWPLAIFPLAGNAALETSYAIPHRLEQLGLPDDLALALAVVGLVGGLVALAREAARGRARLALAACLVLVTTPYLAVWYLAWAVPLAAAEEDAAATVARARPLRVPACRRRFRSELATAARSSDDAVLGPDDVPARVAPEARVGGREPLAAWRRRGSSGASGRRQPSAPRRRTGKLKMRRRAERCAPSVLVALTATPAGTAASTRAAARSWALTR